MMYFLGGVTTRFHVPYECDVDGLVLNTHSGRHSIYNHFKQSCFTSIFVSKRGSFRTSRMVEMFCYVCFLLVFLFSSHSL